MRRSAWWLPLALVAVVSLVGVAAANPMGQQENFVDRPGGDFHSFNAGGASTCSTSCATNADCAAYTYVRSTGVCWMKSTVPARRNDNCCISGVKVMGPQEVNFDRPGSNLGPGFPAVTSSQCESACRVNLQCRSYTWVKPGVQAESGMCWLKSQRPNRSANSCCISGVRLRDPVRVAPGAGDLRIGR